MLFIISLASVFACQISSAQILSLGLQNGQFSAPVLQNVNQNVQRTITVPSNSIILQNSGINNYASNLNTIGNINSGIGNINSGIGTISTGIGNANSLNSLQLSNVPVASNIQLVKNLPVSGVVANNIGSSNIITVPNNLVATNVGSNFGSNIISANVGNNLVGANIGSNLVGANIINTNLGSNVNNGNWVNANVPVNLANGFNINTGTFAIGNTGLANILPSGHTCGIQILGDALQVGGAVDVNGQLPFYTTVSVNGVLPSSGVGVVNCGCGGQGS